MLRVVKAKNARSKRALDKKQPKVTENVKQALFILGSTGTGVVREALIDLNALKKPYAKRFQRKNEIRPFEDSSSFEFLSEKNDTSLIVLGTHSKKRPNCLTFARTFNYQVFDVIELKIVQAKFLKDFKKTTFDVGMKPMFTFNGAGFENNHTLRMVRSLFLDFFRGEELKVLDPAGLQHVISLTVEDFDEDGPLPLIRFRVYLLKTVKSDAPKMPRVELDEIGPRFDFQVGRIQSPSPEVEKEAYKVAKTEGKTKKNISMDFMGDKIGRIHMKSQDMGTLQTRKMKGLKRTFDVANAEDGAKSDSEFDSE